MLVKAESYIYPLAGLSSTFDIFQISEWLSSDQKEDGELKPLSF